MADLLADANDKRERARALRTIAESLSLARDRQVFLDQANELDRQAERLEAEARNAPRPPSRHY